VKFLAVTVITSHLDTNRVSVFPVANVRYHVVFVVKDLTSNYGTRCGCWMRVTSASVSHRRHGWTFSFTHRVRDV